MESEGLVLFRVSRERVQGILYFIGNCTARGVVTASDAAHLRGKLYFSFSAAVGRVGRAATLPLVQRQYRDTSTALVAGSELDHSFRFFRALLPRLPDLLLSLSVRDEVEPPLLVYTDAAFWWRSTRRSVGGSCSASRRVREPMGDLGAVVYDPRDGSVRVAAATPPWDLYSEFLSSKETHIAFLEALAALSVYSTYPELFARRSVNHFIECAVLAVRV